MNVSEALARAVALEIGDTPVYGLIGDANLHLVGALRRYTDTVLRFARDEGAALAMADGHAQATGTLGIASVTSGPGLTHAATSLLAAGRMRTPMIILAGDTPMRRPAGLQEMQDFDQKRFADACEAGFQALRSVETLADDIRAAFYRARTGRMPVVLDVPLDLQTLAVAEGWRYQPSHAAMAERRLPEPHAASIAAVADILARASTPLLIAGRGAVRAGARDAIAALADATGALLGTSLLAKGFFGRHPWSLGVVGGYCTPAGEALVKQADTIIAFGAELGHFTTQANTLLHGRTVVHIDMDPYARSLPLPFALAVQGDAAAAARAIAAAMAGRSGHARFRTAEAKARLAAPWPDYAEARGDAADPRKLMQRLGACLPDNARIVVGGGHFWSFPCLYLDPPAGGDYLCPLGAAAIGQALPFAIGVAGASAGRPVVVVEGDGSLMMNIQELDTAAQLRLPIVLVVMNDGALTAERIKLKSEGYDPGLAIYPKPDFPAIARGFGWQAASIRSASEIDAVLKSRDWSGGPLLIDAHISRDVLVDPVSIHDLGHP